MPLSTRPQDSSADTSHHRGSPQAANSQAPPPTWQSVKVYVNGITWWVRPGWEWVVYGPKAPNWLHLVAEPHAEPVKRNIARQVWRVAVNGEEFFAKLYRETGLGGKIRALFRGPGCSLEWRATAHAVRHDIATVEPIAYGSIGLRGLGGPGILITHALPEAVPLHTYWEQSVAPAGAAVRRRRANAIIEATADAIARAHQYGFHHRDLHSGNLLVSPSTSDKPRVVFVDLHNVRVGQRVSDRQALRNLAQLNQWFRRRATRTDRLRFLRHYVGHRNELSRRAGSGSSIELEFKDLVRALDRTANDHARALWAKRDRVALRDGKYFCRIKAKRGWRGHAFLVAKHVDVHSRASQMRFKRAQWEKWLSDPQSLLRGDRGDVIKDSHTAYVCRTQLPTDEGPLEVICKRHRPRTWLKRIHHMLRDSRNLRAWKRGYQLINRDLSTARPLAVMERRFLGLLIDSISVSEAIPQAKDLDSFLRRSLYRLDDSTKRRVKDQLIEAGVRLIKSLQEKGFSHRDFKAPNLLVQWDSSLERPPRLTLVDLDGLALRSSLTRRDLLRPLMRLNVSLDDLPQVTRTDRLRFLKAYMVGPGRSDADWKSLWVELREMSEKKRRHREKRRQAKLKRYGRV